MTTEEQMRACYYCGHSEIQSAPLSQGMFGELRCSLCSTQAVVDDHIAIALRTKVLNWMIQDKDLFPSGGATAALAHFKIRLSASKDDMSGCEAYVVSKQQQECMLHCLTCMPRCLQKSNIIVIRSGLPKWYFEAVLAHELGHLFLDSLPGEVHLPSLIEEGFCQVLAYHYGLVHSHQHCAFHAYHDRFSGPYRQGFSFLKPVYDRGEFQGGHGLRSIVRILRDLKQSGKASLSVVADKKIKLADD